MSKFFLFIVDLIALSTNNTLGVHNPFLRISSEEMNKIIECVQDDNLKNSLIFGIGLHHAGLIESDRKIIENLFFTK